MQLLNSFLKHGDQEYTHKNLGLERVQIVLERLGHPEKSYPSVLIAGTNGKGSVSRMVESVMLAAGYPVGLYTSPHLERFTERIRVGGGEVSEEFLEQVLQNFYDQGLLSTEGEIEIPVARGFSPAPDCQVRSFGPEAGLKPLATWFEKVTILAFEVFRRKKVPLAVIEVGLGARLDATNVVDPIVSAITSIGLDHTEVLGESPFEIAQEKLAVMRPGRPLVLGQMDSQIRTFLSKAARLAGAKPVMPKMPEGTWREFAYGPFNHLRLSLPGRHQLGNAATAIEMLVALKEAGFNIENSHIHRGLPEAKLPSRLEIFPGSPPIVLDGAHNPPSMEVLFDFIREEFPGRPVTLVLAMMRDKDCKKTLEKMGPMVREVIFTEIPSPRSLSTEEWGHLLSPQPKDLHPYFVKDPQAALASARQTSPTDGLVVVAGSFYLSGMIRPMLNPLRIDPTIQ